jgi:glutamyl-tRNA reductase
MAEFERQRAKRSELSDAQWEQVDAVTRAMMAKLLHQPTMVLKDAAGTPRGERLVEALRTLFDL